MASARKELTASVLQITGELESIQASGKDEIIVQFSTRGAAEQVRSIGCSS